MRIGIISLPLHTNYGGILQAYALISVLKRMGHEVCYIQRIEEPLTVNLNQVILTAVKRFISHIIKGTKIQYYNIRKELRAIEKDYIIHSQYCDSFIKKYIPLRVVKNYNEIREGEFDALVVGSDQVWRPKYFGPEYITDAYLGFAREWDVLRVAYAPSFGSDKWEYSDSQTKQCRALIRQFDQITIRELSGVDLLRRYFGIESRVVLDPTMLLDRTDYCVLGKECFIKGDLLCYVRDSTQEARVILNEVINRTQLLPFFLNSKWSDLNAPIVERIQKPVENWIAGFRDCKLVITDSFHACAFSIIFNVPFWVISNESRGLGRIISLLEMFGLSNRLVSKNGLYQINLFDSIDWNSVNGLIKRYRENSQDVLKVFLS